jgi:hypothetical protein
MGEPLKRKVPPQHSIARNAGNCMLLGKKNLLAMNAPDQTIYFQTIILHGSFGIGCIDTDVNHHLMGLLQLR